MEDPGDDGRIRTGTVWTAAAHAVTAVVGSGVLALPWSVAQLGWVLGPIVLIFFAYVTYHAAILLSDCYRSPDPINGRRNYTYMDAIRSFLGKRDVLICGAAQCAILWGALVGYTITATMSMMAIQLSQCHHERGHHATCKVSGVLFTVFFGAAEIVLSQFPNLEKIAVISYVAAAMSFIYSFIGLYLSASALYSHHNVKGSLFIINGGRIDSSVSTKVWNSFQALGNIAFAYTYAMVLIEIQDTLKSPPSENKTMKRATLYGIGVTTLFYISLGCVGYAALGTYAPGNILTGFYEPYWLIDTANLAVLIHLAGAYQVFAQPIYAFYEEWMQLRWPHAEFFHRIHTVKFPIFSKSRSYKFTLCKLLLRTAFVVVTTTVATLLPFFNAVVGLLGSMAFWPLTVYYPVAMHMVQADVKRGQPKWLALQLMSSICLLVSLFSAVGSVANIAVSLKGARFFQFQM